MYCSVCVPKGTSIADVEKQVNAENPTNITSDWVVSKDTHFQSGEPNPHPCENDSNNLHYLLNC